MGDPSAPKGVTLMVHCVSYSSQPDVWRDCDRARARVAWEHPREADGVYSTTEGWGYTFEVAGVTCPRCLRVMQGLDPIDTEGVHHVD